MGPSACEISFPLLVFNRSRLSYGKERKLSKPTNLFALLQLQPATPRDAEPTTLFLIHPQIPNPVLALVFFVVFNCNAATQIKLFFLSLFRLGNH